MTEDAKEQRLRAAVIAACGMRYYQTTDTVFGSQTVTVERMAEQDAQWEQDRNAAIANLTAYVEQRGRVAALREVGCEHHPYIDTPTGVAFDCATMAEHIPDLHFTQDRWCLRCRKLAEAEQQLEDA